MDGDHVRPAPKEQSNEWSSMQKTVQRAATDATMSSSVQPVQRDDMKYDTGTAFSTMFGHPLGPASEAKCGPRDAGLAGRAGSAPSIKCQQKAQHGRNMGKHKRPTWSKHGQAMSTMFSTLELDAKNNGTARWHEI